MPDSTRVHDLKTGHVAIEGRAPWGRPIARAIPAWGEKGKQEVDAIIAELQSRLGPARAERIADRDRNMVIFPNLVINDIMAITVRTFFPIAPDLINVSSWALAPKGETPEFRKRRLDNFLEFLGPGGFATPDDIEALESAQLGYVNQDQAPWNDLSRGMTKEVAGGNDEEQMRCFWREWSKRMEQAG
jgi:p-cumate 2,3-dioxygenase alpha subunit